MIVHQNALCVVESRTAARLDSSERRRLISTEKARPMHFDAQDRYTWTAWRMDRLVAVLERRSARCWVVDDQNGNVTTHKRRRDAINAIMQM